MATPEFTKPCGQLHSGVDSAEKRGISPQEAKQPSNRYWRFRIERVVFLATFGPMLGSALFLASGDPEAFMVVLFVPLYYVLTYIFVKIDGRRVGSLMEECTDSGEASSPMSGLTLRRYLMEYVNFVGVVLVLFVFIAGRALGASLGDAIVGNGGPSSGTT